MNSLLICTVTRNTVKLCSKNGRLYEYFQNLDWKIQGKNNWIIPGPLYATGSDAKFAVGKLLREASIASQEIVRHAHATFT